ncbi:hypothetical protein AVL50_26910 [Flammeovirga sp. SJP92]|nr:hypothetical protein AVL50_26910 [Flammeovirga sp. SJP92]
MREWVADGQSIVGQTYTENGHEITIVKLSVTDFDLVVVEYIWNLSEIEARAMSSLLKGNLTKVCETFMKGGNLNDVMLKYYLDDGVIVAYHDGKKSRVSYFINNEEIKW